MCSHHCAMSSSTPSADGSPGDGIGRTDKDGERDAGPGAERDVGRDAGPGVERDVGRDGEGDGSWNT